MLKTIQLDALKSEGNAARIACPVFKREAPVADCFSLHSEFMVGRYRRDRGACLACMSASKCPVSDMLRALNENPKLFYSAEPTVVSLPAEVIEAVTPRVVWSGLLDRFLVSDEERIQIDEATAALSDRKPRSRRTVVAPPRNVAIESSEAKTDSFADKLHEASDIAGAISREVKKEATKQPKPAGGMSLLEMASQGKL